MMGITWTLNRVLAVAALMLGAVAVLGNPYRGRVVRVPAEDLAAMVQNQVDGITVDELAAWIVEGRGDYRLLDLRAPESFSQYRIPTAENVAVAGLADYPILSNEKIIVYADGEVPAAQAWMLLKTMGYGSTYLLRGGLDLWKDRILFPSAPGDPNPNVEAQREFAKRVEVARFFGGSPRTGDPGAGMEATPVPLPKVEMPAGPVVAVKKKRKKEGC